jgi:hypothetical protein
MDTISYADFTDALYQYSQRKIKNNWLCFERRQTNALLYQASEVTLTWMGWSYSIVTSALGSYV